MIELIEVLKAVLFGIVEGVTEWLPISSTGHLILLNEVVKLKVSDEFYSMFEVVIQLGAILAVVVLFWSQIWPFGRKNNVAPLTKRGPGAWIKTDIFKLWFHILVSTIPAAVIGVLADDWVEKHFYNYQMVSVMLILFGIAFILIENSHKGKNVRIHTLADIGYDTALFIGLFQLIAAIFPGTSRLRCNDCRSTFDRGVQNCCGRVYVFPCHSGYVWCQYPKDCKVWTGFFDIRGRYPVCGMCHCICGFPDRYPFSDGIY